MSHEIDGVVNIYPTPGFLRQHPRMVGRLCKFILVFGAGRALMTRVLNSCVDPQPVDCCSCQLFHPLHTEMAFMKNLQHFWLQASRYHDSIAIRETSVDGSQ